MSARCLNCGRPGCIGLCIICSASEATGCTGSIDGECCDRPAHPDCALAGPYTEQETTK